MLASGKASAGGDALDQKGINWCNRQESCLTVQCVILSPEQWSDSPEKVFYNTQEKETLFHSVNILY